MQTVRWSREICVTGLLAAKWQGEIFRSSHTISMTSGSCIVPRSICHEFSFLEVMDTGRLYAGGASCRGTAPPSNASDMNVSE
ncbi:hypothetical protein J3459_009902 [Metarhizium acridum]|nr:hypothetical protein J3459_009902 [Metarhizium acridum]